MDMYGIYAVNTHCDPNGGYIVWRLHATNGIIIMQKKGIKELFNRP